MKKIINAMSRSTRDLSLGLLFIRVALGTLFLSHGWMKVAHLSATAAMFAHLGFFPWVGYFIAWLEVIGGLALILGVATRFFGILFTIEMLVAVVIGNLARAIGGVELLLALASFGIALTGSGRFSVFPLECRDCGGMLCRPGSPECWKKA